jgi:hypothetical protein
VSISDVTSSSPGLEPRSGEPAEGAPLESRSFQTDNERARGASQAPTVTLRLPNGKKIQLSTDRVRARPAVTPTIAGTLGQNAVGLGVWGTFFPNSVNRFLGMNADPNVIRVAFGVRELYTGFSLIGDPTRKDALWARVAGDLFDIAVLNRLNRPDNPKQKNVRLALGVVLAVTALDAIAATRMSTVKRSCS